MRLYGIDYNDLAGITDEERKHIILLEKERNPKIDRIDFLRYDGDEIEYKVYYPIVRTRRITGYLAPIEAFNDSKRCELEDRYAHMTVEQRAIKERV